MIVLVLHRIEVEDPRVLMVQKAKKSFRINIVCAYGCQNFQNIVPKVSICNPVHNRIQRRLLLNLFHTCQMSKLALIFVSNRRANWVYAEGKRQRFQMYSERPIHLDAGDISCSHGVQPQMTTLLWSRSRAMFKHLQICERHFQRSARVEFAGQRMQSHAIRVCKRRHFVEGCSLQN